MNPVDDARDRPPVPEDGHGLVAAHAVGALDAAEARAAEEHLARCAPCRAELADLRAALADLGSVDAVAPPPSLKEAVMARLDDVEQLPPLPARDAVPPARDELAARRERGRPGREGRWWAPALAAAAVAVLVVGGLGLGWTALELREDRDRARSLAAALGEVAAAPDAVVVEAAAGSGRGWRGTRLVLSAEQGRAVLLDGGTAPAPEDRTYQLWYVASGGAVPAGTFEGGGDPGAVLTGSPQDAAAVAVTLEPEGGSDQPTTEPVATYPLATAA
ncbi:anti-sigma factor [Quadrisphaera sp. DSM 44207]|uniref:anti-sigma factor n=1 Tax=Quadrisphaera sp. DSM 44207 TaxID=1881057 RepID=UPI000888A592|nr:anti-sigma factor [Quadrisphaera sp. DSM 44207]SDQ17518.1 Anti-sigma-K factor RskA [Quadrisphaera sp. DSM 44207]